MLCAADSLVHPGSANAYNPGIAQTCVVLPLFNPLTRISPSLAAAANFGLSGAAFAIGNLLLARQMRIEAYASLSLCTAVFVVFSQVATLGYSQVAQRQALPAGRELLLRLFVQGLVFGAAAAALVRWHYGVDVATALWMVLVTIAGTIIWVLAASLVRAGQKGWAYLVQILPDCVFLVLGLCALMAPRWADSATWSTYCFVVVLIALGASIVHSRLVRPAEGERRSIGWPLLWTSTAIVAGGILLSQIERLAVGFLLQPEDLAMFGVLASIAVFAFRLVSTGVNFVLTPSLRNIPDAEGRRRLVRHELRVIVAALLAATVGICLVGPYVAGWITAGRYEPGVWLLLAACLAGVAKVLHGIPRAIIVACGTDEELGLLSRFVWLGVVFGALGAVAGARAGLIGVLVGIAAGSILGAIPAARMASRLLNSGTSQTRPPHTPSAAR